jgi:hypothetical protein
VRQLDPLAMRLLGRHGVIPAATLRAIAEEIEPRLARWGRLKLLTCVLVAAGLFTLHAFGDTLPIGTVVRASAGGVISAALASAVPFFLVCLFCQRLHRASFQRIGPVMLKHRRCPHCGDDLRGLGTDPDDGCTVCPECGSAWSIDDAAIAERLASIRPPVRLIPELGEWGMVGGTSALVVMTLVGVVSFVMSG